ncbi:hypothetical protein [Ferroplasma sp.]|uniref:hypothetical protein n=1 Tax=Ferroplasma sp. TaxID=2591003 RepID=UPI00307E32CE
MEFKLTIDKMESLKEIIADQISKMESIPADCLEISDIFYYSGLKKWTVTIIFSKGQKSYKASMDILENGVISRFQQRENYEN